MALGVGHDRRVDEAEAEIGILRIELGGPAQQPGGEERRRVGTGHHRLEKAPGAAGSDPGAQQVVGLGEHDVEQQQASSEFVDQRTGNPMGPRAPIGRGDQRRGVADDPQSSGSATAPNSASTSSTRSARSGSPLSPEPIQGNRSSSAGDAPGLEHALDGRSDVQPSLVATTPNIRQPVVWGVSVAHRGDHGQPNRARLEGTPGGAPPDAPAAPHRRVTRDLGRPLAGAAREHSDDLISERRLELGVLRLAPRPLANAATGAGVGVGQALRLGLVERLGLDQDPLALVAAAGPAEATTTAERPLAVRARRVRAASPAGR